MTAPPRRRRRQDSPTWIAAAALTVAGLGLWLAVAPQPAPAGGPAADRDEAPPAARAAYPAPPSPGRIEAFRTRVARFAPLEAGIWRAFFPPPPPPVRHGASRLARVAPGATPQACLAQAVYYEARGEPAEGQAAVAQVVLNRTRDGAHPASVCGVVFQGAARPGCQFSFACDARLAGRRVDAASWGRAERVAATALGGREVETLRSAVNYHADYVSPRWASSLRRTAEIGRHVFYAAWSPVAHAAGWAAPAGGERAE